MFSRSAWKASNLFTRQHFLRSSSTMANSRPRIALILDFDGTITKTDTTSIIGSQCLSKARELAQPGLFESQLPKSMDFYSQKYMQDYQAWKDTRKESLEDCKTVEEVVFHLSASRCVEQNSFLRVREAVLNVPGEVRELERSERARDDFMMDCGRRAMRSGEIQIRDPHALGKLISFVATSGNFHGIVSVSWSRRFILGVLLEAGYVEDKSAEDFVKRIWCNELLAPNRKDEHGRPLIICTAQDKLDAFNELMSTFPPEERKATVPVYVGDSSTDVGCLAAAAVGFHLKDSSASENLAVQAVKRCGIEGRSMSELLNSESFVDEIVEEQQAGSSRHVITEVIGFDEIWQWVSQYFDPHFKSSG